jgi:VIT1/CCC1 family predicted Fe2+/Mn2+ transporter
VRYAGDPTESAEEPATSSSPWWSGILRGVHSESHTAEQNAQRVLLQVVQPALLGLMDGSVSTLAPIFATAYATHTAHTAFLVGVAAAVGAGISMGFAEALSDSGENTGRGHAWPRGSITGGATFIGGIFHTVPFLIPNLQLALYVAYLVVGIELMTIALIRHRFFDMSMVKSAVQVILGGALVFAAGVLIGSS